MIWYDYYADIPAEAIEGLVRESELGRLVSVGPEHPVYRAALGSIAALQLRVRGRRVKFKLGQNRSREVRANIVRELRQRGRRNDSRAADALQWTIDHETRR